MQTCEGMNYDRMVRMMTSIVILEVFVVVISAVTAVVSLMLIGEGVEVARWIAPTAVIMFYINVVTGLIAAATLVLLVEKRYVDQLMKAGGELKKTREK